MVYFSQKSFEKLLFPMHKKIYEQIDNALIAQEAKMPGTMKWICEAAKKFWSLSTFETIRMQNLIEDVKCPDFDVHIAFKCEKMSQIEKISKPLLFNISHQNGGNGNHLIITTIGEKRHSYIVHIPFLLKEFESKVIRPNTYQLYQHTLIKTPDSRPATQAEYEKDAGLYIGLTSRSWQKRYLEHKNQSLRASPLLFHRAIRGELFNVHLSEHIILRVGLSKEKAFDLEEKEVEQRSYNFKFPNGLNMIPGGMAGLRYISKMRKKQIEAIDIENLDSEVAAHIKESMFRPELSDKSLFTNEKLAELWRNDIKYRISAMTCYHRLNTTLKAST